MQRIVLLAPFIFFYQLSFASVSLSELNNEIITLARFYRSFHFANDPSAANFDQLKDVTHDSLQGAKKFIAELVRTNNAILTDTYLTKPDNSTLRYLYIIRSVNWNMAEADAGDNGELIDSIMGADMGRYEILSYYYGMVFTAVTNKNRPFNLKSIDFKMNEYGLENETEKGIFFLEGMEMFGKMIWGFMNIPKPPNYKEALNIIRVFPTFNGQPYYQFQELNFPDFVLILDKRKPKESYKKFQINKYLNTLLYHTMCLGDKKKQKEEREEIMLGSIMHNDSYYKYSEHPEVFERIFQKVAI